jgi:hypothetical protein
MNPSSSLCPSLYSQCTPCRGSQLASSPRADPQVHVHPQSWRRRWREIRHAVAHILRQAQRGRTRMSPSGAACGEAYGDPCRGGVRSYRFLVQYSAAYCSVGGGYDSYLSVCIGGGRDLDPVRAGPRCSSRRTPKREGSICTRRRAAQAQVRERPDKTREKVKRKEHVQSRCLEVDGGS